MNAYEVYRLYVSIRTHFLKADYDHFYYNRKPRNTVKTFLKRDDVYFFEKIADEYPDDPENLFVANFIYDYHDICIRNLAMEPVCIANYHRRRGRLISMEYQTKDQLKGLGSLNSILSVRGRKLPLLLLAHLRNEVDIDSITVLNKAVDFLPMWAENIKDSSIWDHKYMRCKKYAPFCDVSVEAAKRIVRGVYDVSKKT